MAGAKLSAKRRPGPESSGICTARALRHVATTAMASARRASPSHVVSHPAALGCSAATTAAPSAVPPMARRPHPETAVNHAARSMVSRI